MRVLLWGGTGQAKVVKPILDDAGHEIALVFDRNPKVEAPFADVGLIHSERERDEFIARHHRKGLGFVVAIGGDHGRERTDIGEQLISEGLIPLSPVHSSAWIAESASVGAGVQVLAMAAVSEGAIVGDFCVLNTSSSVDHGTRLGAGVHVMPGATVTGEVEVGDFATIGANATVLPRITIGSGAVVGAGAVVTKDVPTKTVVVGNPARVLATG